MRELLVPLGVLTLAASASAATLKVPQQYETIQAAVDAASDGDTILVSKGVYHENVQTGVPNLKLVGKKAVIDGTIGTTPGTCLFVGGAGTTVQGFTFRNGSNHAMIFADGCSVLSCTSVNSSGIGIYVAENVESTISGNRIRGAREYGILVYGASGSTGTVSKNQVSQSQGYGIYINGGTGAVVDRNVVRQALSQAGIFVACPGARVTGNRVSLVGGDSIHVEGDGTLVQANTILYGGQGWGILSAGEAITVDRNSVAGCAAGIACYGPGATVTSNRVAGAHGENYAYDIGGDGFTVTGNSARDGHNYSIGFFIHNGSPEGGGLVEGNTAEDIDYGGFVLENVSNVVVRGCTATRCGVGTYQAGIRVTGTSTTLEDCTATECSDVGIYVNGTGNTLTGCTASDNDVDGFEVFGDGHVLADCTARGNGGAGLTNGGTGTAVQGGTYRDNRQDITYIGFYGATFSGGLAGVDYVTGGETTNSEIWLSENI